MLDLTICPNCNSEETVNDYENVYEGGYSIRFCEECQELYKVHFNVTVSKIEKIPKT